MQSNAIINNLLVLFSLLLVTPVSYAAMVLDSDKSTISFVSIKKGTVGEVHTFSAINGTLSDQGKLSVSIELDSVQTGIDIRNTRMREMLFDTMKFPSAEISATVSKSIPDGQIVPVQVEAMLSLHGISNLVTIHALAVRTGGQLLVTSTQPIIVNAGDFNLVGGIEALRKIAKLSSIPIAIPVSFTLVFK